VIGSATNKAKTLKSVINTTVELAAPELEEDDIDSGIGVSGEDLLEVEAIFTLKHNL